MKRLCRSLALAMLAALAPSVAAAEVIAVGVVPGACAEPGVDASGLRERVALELSTRGAPDVVAPGAGIDVTVTIREGCPETEVEVVIGSRRLAVTRRVTLGEGPGPARVWALALVIVDLLRSPLLAEGPTAVEPAPESASASESEPASASEPEPASASEPASEAAPAPVTDPAPGLAGGGGKEDPGQDWESRLVVAATGRLYLLTPTGLGGLRLALHYDWFGVAVSALGTDAAAASSHLAVGQVLLDVSVRPFEHRDGDWRVGLELAVSGGAAYAVGQASQPSLEATASWFALLGGAARLRTRWIVDPRLALDASLAAGFDAVGSDLFLGVTRAATTWGPWLELTLGGALPL